ncbi:MAG: hypothetical protein IJE60_12485 [Tyzzerella sp.]|nr:hypothetical protein [Tyzzerella sp.]
MKQVKVLLAALLSVTVILGTAVPTYAASSDVKIEVKETTMDNVSVTVPTTIPIVFNADGSNTLPTNWTIENVSTIAGIHLAKIDMDAGSSGWKLLEDSQNVKNLSKDTKSIKFSVGKSGALKLVAPTSGTESTSGSVTFGNTEIEIPSGETQVLSFGVERGAFTKSEASAKAFDMVLTFNFN